MRMQLQWKGAIFAGSLALLGGCGDGAAPMPYGSGTLGAWDGERPSLGEVQDDVPRYRGDHPWVLDAEQRFRTGLDLHKGVIQRTCTPNEGVCHHTKEYPDLHTAANFVAAFEAPCNVQAGTREGVFDRCERPGDRFELASDAVTSGPREVGQLYLVPGEKPSYSKESPPGPADPGLHVILAEPVATDRAEIWAGARFIRTFIRDGLVEDLAFITFTTRWWVLDGGLHLVGEVANYQRDDVTRLMEVGVIEGDANGNGVLGAREADPIPLLAAGDPELSYLIGRVRGELDGEDVPGTRMPLANQPLSAAEMLALYCFVEGFEPGRTDIRSPIDYANCSYSANPEALDLLGAPSEETPLTWEGRVGALIDVNCGGCHDADTPSAGLPLTGDGARAALAELSLGRPDLRFVEPGDPAASYLWLKLVGADTIDGSPMPWSPVTGWRPLRDAELDLIEAWILDGAP
jgi:hypothetical protein